MIEQIKRALSQMSEDLIGLTAIHVYGSVARDEHNSDSDVDLILSSNDRISFDQFDIIESKLSQMLNRKIDATSMNSIEVAERQSRNKDRYSQIRKEMVEVWKK